MNEIKWKEKNLWMKKKNVILACVQQWKKKIHETVLEAKISAVVAVSPFIKIVCLCK